MVETILKKLLDREYADYTSGSREYPYLVFKTENSEIEISYHKPSDNFTIVFHTKNGTCEELVSFEDDIEKTQAILNFKKLVQKGFDKVISQVYAKVMGIEVDPEEQPKTFDDAQTQIVNDNVEE